MSCWHGNDPARCKHCQSWNTLVNRQEEARVRALVIRAVLAQQWADAMALEGVRCEAHFRDASWGNGAYTAGVEIGRLPTAEQVADEVLS